MADSAGEPVEAEELAAGEVAAVADRVDQDPAEEAEFLDAVAVEAEPEFAEAMEQEQEFSEALEPASPTVAPPAEQAFEAPAEVVASETNGAHPEESPPEPKTPSPADEAAAKRAKAVEDFKAAIAKAAAKPVAKKMEVESSLALCLCIKKLAQTSEVFAEFAQELPRLGESHLVPLIGLKRSKATNVELALHGKKVTGRVKSYNTRKGFGFLDTPGFGRDIFVHSGHLIGRLGLVPGEAVSFELMLDQGRPQARQVKALPSGPSDKVMPLPTFSVGRAANLASQAMGLFAPPAISSNPPSIHDLARAMAAAAAEVPTQLPGKEKIQPSPFLEANMMDKIREAQTSAAAALAKQRAQPQPPPPAPNPSWTPPQYGLGTGLADAKTSFSAKYPENGEIPTGSQVRVQGFPASEVNGCLGVIQGFDAATARYSVSVSMRQGGETMQMPMQLKGDYLVVEKMPQSHEGGPQGSALKRSAAEALRRFGSLIAQQPPQPQPRPPMPNPMGMKGGWPPGQPGPQGIPPQAMQRGPMYDSGPGFPSGPGPMPRPGSPGPESRFLGAPSTLMPPAMMKDPEAAFRASEQQRYMPGGLPQPAAGGVAAQLQMQQQQRQRQQQAQQPPMPSPLPSGPTDPWEQSGDPWTANQNRGQMPGFAGAGPQRPTGPPQGPLQRPAPGPGPIGPPGPPQVPSAQAQAQALQQQELQQQQALIQQRQRQLEQKQAQ